MKKNEHKDVRPLPVCQLSVLFFNATLNLRSFMSLSNNNIPASLSSAQRQSPAAIALILARFTRQLARQAWPLVIVFLFRREQSWWIYLLYGTIILTTISSLLSIAAYWRFYFYATADEFVIERGILNRTKLTVPFHRIQTINFQRNLLHRFLGVVGLEIDTAGSQNKELSISALTEAHAEVIREFLLERRGHRGGAKDALQTIETQTLLPDTLLLRLQVGDLLKIGFSQNHLQTAGIILAFLFGLYELAEDVIGVAAQNQAENFGNWVLNSFVFFFLLAVPVLLIAAFFLSLIRTTLRYFNLRFYRTGDGYRVISGLFTEREQHATIQKIQLVQWQTNPLYRLFKMYAIRLKQASSSVVQNRQAINIPGAYTQQVEVVQKSYFPAINDESFSQHTIHPAIIKRRTLYFGLLPALGFSLLTFSPLGFSALWFLALIPAAWFLSRIYYRNWKIELYPNACKLESGIWNRQQTLLQWYKVQAVELQQTPYQRRHKLANVYLYTAAGRVFIPYWPLAKAVALQDYVLYRVETDQRSWM